MLQPLARARVRVSMSVRALGWVQHILAMNECT